jgi:hypothetical protein
MPAFAKIPIKQLGETNPTGRESAPDMRIGPELHRPGTLGQRVLADANPALAEVGRSLSQGWRTAKRAGVAVQKFASLPAARSPCGLLNQKPHQINKLASVLSIPKFVKVGPQEGTNFGIGTLARQIAALKALNLRFGIVAKNLHLRLILLICRGNIVVVFRV